MTSIVRIYLSLILLTSLSAQEEQAESSAGAVHFGNGDILSGSAVGLNKEGHLVWNSETLHSEVPLHLDKILEMSLRSNNQPPSTAPHIAKVTLTNGDTLHGELLALDDKEVTLQTDHSGLLKIRRSMSSKLDITKSERTLYSGPYDFDEWTVADADSDAWSLQNGHLVSREGSSIARPFDLPDKAHFSFTLTWRSSLRFRLLLRSDDEETSQPDNCYDLVYNRRFVYMRKRWTGPNGAGSRIIGQSANIQELNEKETARFDFYLDRKAGTIAFYVDGKQAQVWSDEAPDDGTFGKMIHFIAEDGYPVRVSRIELSEWTSANLPDDRQAGIVNEEALEEGQQIILQNGDVLVGDVGLVKDGVLEVTTAHTPIKVPIERMSSVHLTDKSDANYEEPIRKPGDVRAWFRSGGRITFRLDSFSDGKLEGFSQTFGTATFDSNAFSRIEFNIYNEDYRSLRQETSW